MPVELTAKAKVFVYRIATMSMNPAQRGYLECVKPVQYPSIPLNAAKVPCDYPGQGLQQRNAKENGNIIDLSSIIFLLDNNRIMLFIFFEF